MNENNVPAVSDVQAAIAAMEDAASIRKSATKGSAAHEAFCKDENRAERKAGKLAIAYCRALAAPVPVASEAVESLIARLYENLSDKPIEVSEYFAAQIRRFTHPAPVAADARDAARYRFLRNGPCAFGNAIEVNGKYADIWYSMETLDAAIDAALSPPASEVAK